MTTQIAHLDHAPVAAAGRASGGWRLLRAEVLKLRRRRGLVVLTTLLTIVPMLIGYGVAVGLHLANPDEHGPAGGLENLGGPLELLAILAGVAALLIGVTAGAGDLNAGVFRELVTTGRSRRALFLARVPAGLIVLLPFVAVAFAMVAIGSVAFAGSLPEPGLGELAAGAGWLLIGVTTSYLLALGVASVIGSRSASIAGLLAWSLAIAPLLSGASFLGVVREGMLISAMNSLAPDSLGLEPDVAMSAPAIVGTLLLWSVVPLLLGSWRTETRDA